jgi:hypothetical protein
VHPYADHYEPVTNVPIAKVVTAYDHPVSGETYILVFGQALYMGDSIEHTLIYPNQAQTDGVVVDDIPRHLSHDNTSTHSIYFSEEDVCLPLCLRGIISYLPTRYPTNDEINKCKWLIVTKDTPWNPYNDSFTEQESSYLNFHNFPIHRNIDEREIMTFHSELFCNVCSISTTPPQLNVSDQHIAKIFQCSPKTAAHTRQITTQKGLHSMTDHLTRRYRTKQAALCYAQLGGRHGHFYSNTLFSLIPSL